MDKVEKFVDGTIVYRRLYSTVMVGRVVSLPDGEQVIIYRPDVGQVDHCNQPEEWTTYWPPENGIRREVGDQ